MFVSIMSFVFVLGILVFIHELGHFLVAKKVGIKVEKFSLGFPPNIFSKKYGETTYCIGIIPLGGFVKMAGEEPTEEVTGDPREFMSKTVGQRMAVIFAGPFMNYVLSIIILISIFYFGGRPLFDENRVLVGDITADGPVSNSSLKTGDEIIAVNGEYLHSFDSLRSRINAIVEAPVEITWIAAATQDTMSESLTTYAAQQPNIEGGVDTVGLIGFSQQIIGYESYGFGRSVKEGFVLAHVLVEKTISFVGDAVTGNVSMKMVGGPLFIAQQSGQEARKGPASLFLFMALLSVNLAVINILPIPVLDGGHLVFLIIEKIKGSPVPMKIRIYAQQIGIVALLGLILFVTYNDVLRVFRGF